MNTWSFDRQNNTMQKLPALLTWEDKQLIKKVYAK